MQKTIIVSCFTLLLPVFGLAGCSDSALDKAETPVPIRLYAGSGEVMAGGGTKATEEALPTTIFASTVQGEYAVTGVNANSASCWMRAATVAGGETGAKRNVSFTTEPDPTYPVTGDWIYLVGIAPAVESAADGKVTYTVDGKTDILYAAEIRGNKWEGDQFGEAENKYLTYVHKLTKLDFEGKVKTGEELAKLVLQEIRIKGVRTSASLVLKNGDLTFQESTGDVTLTTDLPTEGLTTSVQTLGSLLLPPGVTSYQTEVKTSYGTFNGEIKLSNNSAFASGSSHVITFTFSGQGLSVATVAVEGWNTTTPSGGDDLPVN